MKVQVQSVIPEYYDVQQISPQKKELSHSEISSPNSYLAQSYKAEDHQNSHSPYLAKSQVRI